MSEGPSIIPPGSRTLSDEERQALLDDMAEVIGSSHLFKSLDETGRERVLSYGYVCRYDAGDVIIEEGDVGDTMFVVISGTVTVETGTTSGKLQLAELGRGACVGEVSVLGGGPRTATVTAKTDVDCVAFHRHRIERVLSDYPKVHQLLQALVEGRARDTIEKIVGS